jgi:hypothetical protein
MRRINVGWFCDQGLILNCNSVSGKVAKFPGLSLNLPAAAADVGRVNLALGCLDRTVRNAAEISALLWLKYHWMVAEEQ